VTLTLLRPVDDPPAVNAGGDDVHMVCCRPTVALCGDQLDGDFDDDGDSPVCVACVVRLDAGDPCGARFCRLRSWWRERWSS
jgi:hypothetical protein